MWNYRVGLDSTKSGVSELTLGFDDQSPWQHFKLSCRRGFVLAIRLRTKMQAFMAETTFDKVK